ncbi:glycoside hydrolase family 38 C-terminal domain-containing protein [Lactococcus protaetiae]|uniref:glycoside hydrolase family 38 C-terminal domain-containing protein n=1 Tax=Lactococcus protaetiae TaxID=2592653 RepID=UPI001CC1E198|nr:glycoside hydrolase family 38 C-terminal domain-containing protein [Lactococcus protaetiae]
MIDFYKRKIVEATPDKAGFDKLGIFNFLPYATDRLVKTLVTTRWGGFELIDVDGNPVSYALRAVSELDPGLIDRQIVHYGNYEPFFQYEIELMRELPAMGYELLYVSEATRPELTGQPTDKLLTDYFELIGNADGTVNITDRKSKRTYENVFSLDDTADDGDEYDFSPLADEIPISSIAQAQASVKILEYENEFILTSDYEFEVPSELTESRQRTDSIVKIPVSLKLFVEKHSPIIKVELTIENTAKDHRLRLLIPTGIASSMSFASNQFGTIRRPVVDDALAYWEAEGWDERPDAIYPFLGLVGLEDDQHAVAVLTNSSREYEIVGQQFDTIAITVLRSVGVLGKEELHRRPGRPSGIKLPTPDSQMLGKLTLDLALTFANSAVEVAQAEKIYHAKVESYNQMPFHAMKLNKSKQITPCRYSMFSAENHDLVLSTVKKSENTGEILARFYNPSQKSVKLELAGFDHYVLHSLKEVIRDRTFDGTVKPNQVITVRISV